MGVALLLTVACAWLPRAATVPMSVLVMTDPTPDGEAMVVFLPGRFDRPERLVREGFGEVLAARLPAVNAVAADAHLGYYLDGSFVERLHEDVVQPALGQGASRIHLVGISMGGLGALLYARAHPEEVAGLVVLAPYLGEEKVIEEIAAAGGLAAWQPPAEPDPDDFQRDVWTWLKGYAEPGAGRPPLVVGWGDDDDLAPASRLLAAVLPAGRAFTVRGGHDWTTWRALWQTVVDAGVLGPSGEMPSGR